MSSRPDPIREAGRQWCPRCRTEAFPRDAAWIGEDLILVTYERLCEHQGETTQLVVPSGLTVATDRCHGYTVAGTWCLNRPRRGARYCGAHGARDANAALAARLATRGQVPGQTEIPIDDRTRP